MICWRFFHGDLQNSTGITSCTTRGDSLRIDYGSAHADIASSFIKSGLGSDSFIPTGLYTPCVHVNPKSGGFLIVIWDGRTWAVPEKATDFLVRSKCSTGICASQQPQGTGDSPDRSCSDSKNVAARGLIHSSSPVSGWACHHQFVAHLRCGRRLWLEFNR